MSQHTHDVCQFMMSQLISGVQYGLCIYGFHQSTVMAMKRFMLSHDGVTIDGVLIGNWIY
jgi:hypothetical protein